MLLCFKEPAHRDTDCVPQAPPSISPEIIEKSLGLETVTMIHDYSVCAFKILYNLFLNFCSDFNMIERKHTGDF